MCHSVLLLREHENVLLYDVIFTIYVISRIYAFKNRKFPQHTINIFDFRFSLSLYLIDRLQFITSFSFSHKYSNGDTAKSNQTQRRLTSYTGSHTLLSRRSIAGRWYIRHHHHRWTLTKLRQSHPPIAI